MEFNSGFKGLKEQSREASFSVI